MEKHRASQTNDTDTIYLASAPINTDVDNADLTGKETRQIVTPYAFFVADELLGTRLAGPFRRGFGMLIDGSADAERRLTSMLHWDVNNGIARRSWARNEGAEWAIQRAMEQEPLLKVTLPAHADDDLITDALN